MLLLDDLILPADFLRAFFYEVFLELQVVERAVFLFGQLLLIEELGLAELAGKLVDRRVLLSENAV